ncbi:MAG TPA: sporulation protein YqfD, partial [Clostridia bacterium]|nr:sporulation protein YqfD [Clostridia bacterium]
MRRQLGSVQFMLEGLSLEKMLNLCLQQGILLENVSRPTVRSLSARVAYSDFAAIQDMAERRGWKLTVGMVSGIPKVRRFVWKRAALVAGILIFLAVAWGMSACVWQIRIEGAGPYVGEVRTVLKEQQVQLGRFGFTIDVESLRTALERRLTGLAWVSVELDGVRLTVYCVQGEIPGEKTGNGRPGDVTAEVDGVIESVRVSAGTAAVKPGDVVRAGQVLIYGRERSWQQAVRPVRASGQILARVWYQAEVVVPATEWVTVPTGEVTERAVYCSPWIEWSFSQAPENAKDLDFSERRLVIGGVLPVWVRLERYEAVTLEERDRDETG